jgi:hypothetical protein
MIYNAPRLVKNRFYVLFFQNLLSFSPKKLQHLSVPHLKPQTPVHRFRSNTWTPNNRMQTAFARPSVFVAKPTANAPRARTSLRVQVSEKYKGMNCQIKHRSSIEAI